MSFLAAIPFPLRLVLFALAGMVIFTYIGALEGLLIALAILFWVLVLLGLLYAAGYLNALARVPVVSHILGALTGASPSPQGQAAARPAAAGQRELSDSERASLLAEGEATLRSLVGVEPAIEAIDQRLLDVARSEKQRGGSGFGSSAPALVVILCGPPGVGKSDAAAAIAKLYAGGAILKTSKVVVLRERDVKGGYGSGAAQAALEAARAALDGALLLDDADWMVAADQTFGTTPGVDVGNAILEVAEEAPQRLLVLLTLSPAGAQRLRNDERHARWLNRLTVRVIDFHPLDDENLSTLLRRNLNQRGLQLESAAERPVANLLRDMRKTMGEERFDNAIACRRLAEDLGSAMLARGGGAEGGAITREDVRTVEGMT